MDATKFSKVVELNVGGKLMTTLLSTLTKEPESMLAAMFSGRHVISKDKDGRFFIDCDGNLFEYILNFLRFGTLPTKEKALEIYDIAVYFNVQPLVDSLESYHAVQYRNGIEEMKSSLDMKEYNRLKQDAMQQLNNSCAKTEDDIIILFIPPNNRYSTKCCGPLKVETSPCIIFRHAVFLQTRDEKTKEMKLCIAQDLNQLGFGKYVYTDKTKRFQCINCEKWGGAEDNVFLVAYKIMECWSDDYERLEFRFPFTPM